MEGSPQRQERQISPEGLSQKVSLFMTKPENTDTKAPLLLFLKANNLKAEVFRFILNQEMLDKLYPDIQSSPELVQATNDHMLGKKVEVFLVTKDADNTSEESVLDQVVELVGKKTRPEDNKDGTLRKHLHGETKTYPDKSGKDVLYSENGFHRPLTSKELVDQLEIFGLLEEAKGLI
jgi:hypothetical protein